MRLKPFVAALAGVALAACAGVLAPRSIDIDRARIEQAIARRFPFDTRWLGLIDVTASAPTLRLLPETDRIAADIDLTAGERLFARSVRGSMSVEGALRYEPGDATLRLVDVRVDRLALAGLPDFGAPQAARFGALVAEQLFDGAVLYTLTEAQRQQLRDAGVQPKAIHVTRDGLRIALE